MLEDIIRNFYVLIIAIYSFYKLLNIKPQTRFKQLTLIFFSIITSVFSGFLFHKNFSTNWLFILLIFFILMKCFTSVSLSATYTSVLFSYALSFTAFSFSAIIAAYTLLPFYYKKYEMPWYLIRILTGIIHFLFIYCCFRIPRLQKGMKFLYHIPSGNIGSTICIVLFMLLLMYAQTQTYAETFILSCSAIVLAIVFFLFFWWNYHITQTYKKYTRKNEIDSLNLLLEERNQQILYLKNENDKLAKIIHKDNKIIPALSLAILDSQENESEFAFPQPTSDSSLHTKLKQLYDERVEILTNYEQEILRVPSTGFDSINAILAFMQTEALKHNISYQVILFNPLTSMIPKEISENDFVHILSDLLSNAIYASKNTTLATIRIYLGTLDDIGTIKIQNTGAVFQIETLKNLGLARHTTHTDTGGCGIGLMDIWMLKERYKATLFIDEVTDSSSAQPYTSINILFNHKNHYIIQSDRNKELSTYINRPDILILGKE